MTAAEKIDYTLIPVIDVAHELLGQETRERTTRQRKALSTVTAACSSTSRKIAGTHTAMQRAAMPSTSSALPTAAIIKPPSIGCGRMDMSHFSASGRHPRRIVKEYDYTDENGTRLYQVVRFEPKDFRQRRSDGNGGWIWKGPERPVPYKLPELIASGNAAGLDRRRREGCR